MTSRELRGYGEDRVAQSVAAMVNRRMDDEVARADEIIPGGGFLRRSSGGDRGVVV